MVQTAPDNSRNPFPLWFSFILTHPIAPDVLHDNDLQRLQNDLTKGIAYVESSDIELILPGLLHVQEFITHILQHSQCCLLIHLIILNTNGAFNDPFLLSLKESWCQTLERLKDSHHVFIGMNQSNDTNITDTITFLSRNPLDTTSHLNNIRAESTTVSNEVYQEYTSRQDTPVQQHKCGQNTQSNQYLKLPNILQLRFSIDILLYLLHVSLLPTFLWTLISRIIFSNNILNQLQDDTKGFWDMIQCLVSQKVVDCLNNTCQIPLTINSSTAVSMISEKKNVFTASFPEVSVMSNDVCSSIDTIDKDWEFIQSNNHPMEHVFYDYKQSNSLIYKEENLYYQSCMNTILFSELLTQSDQIVYLNGRESYNEYLLTHAQLYGGLLPWIVLQTLRVIRLHLLPLFLLNYQLFMTNMSVTQYHMTCDKCPIALLWSYAILKQMLKSLTEFKFQEIQSIFIKYNQCNTHYPQTINEPIGQQIQHRFPMDDELMLEILGILSHLSVCNLSNELLLKNISVNNQTSQLPTENQTLYHLINTTPYDNLINLCKQRSEFEILPRSILFCLSFKTIQNNLKKST